MKMPPAPIVLPGFDGRAFAATLEAGKLTRRILFTITGTALSMATEALPPEVALARASDGASAIEQTLCLPEPPDRIEAGSTGLRFVGGEAARHTFV